MGGSTRTPRLCHAADLSLAREDLNDRGEFGGILAAVRGLADCVTQGPYRQVQRQDSVGLRVKRAAQAMIETELVELIALRRG